MMKTKNNALATGTSTLQIFLCALIVFTAVFSPHFNTAFAGCEDFVLDGMFEAAIGLPQILFVLKRDPNGEPIKIYDFFEDEYVFVEQYAYLDTGASGVLFSRETALTYMELNLDPSAVYYDVGVGGAEAFDISEPIYIGTLAFDSPQYMDHDAYKLHDQWQVQVKQTFAEGWFSFPIDVIGMPAMMGKIVVLDAAATNQIGSFSADIKEPNAVDIPEVDFEVALNFERFVWSSEDPNNIPPYPILAYNPMIDTVLDHNGTSVNGRFLLDTGAMVSMINVDTAVALGLTDVNGEPIVEPNFVIQLGGVGSIVVVPGFRIDYLKVPTLNGFDLVYKDALLTVHDIGVYDFDNEEYIILDGIFGSNFLCATMDSNIIDFNFDLAGTVYDRIVIDMNQGILAFDVNDAYPVPNCFPTDLIGDCNVNPDDPNTFSNPWPAGDFNRDCIVDIRDFLMLANEWLSDCNWLNWNCLGTDTNRDGRTNNKDFTDFSRQW